MRHFNRERFQSLILTIEAALIIISLATGSDAKVGMLCYWSTLAALKAFQEEAAIDVDGIYGPVSKAALEKAYAGSGGQSTTPTTQPTTDNEKAIWDRLMSATGNAYGVAGIMGNFKAESNCHANNLQNSYEKSLGMTDDQYTAAVDNGSYTNFVHDSAGYGLYQATYTIVDEQDGWGLLQDYAAERNGWISLKYAQKL